MALFDPNFNGSLAFRQHYHSHYHLQLHHICLIYLTLLLNLDQQVALLDVVSRSDLDALNHA